MISEIPSTYVFVDDLVDSRGTYVGIPIEDGEGGPLIELLLVDANKIDASGISTTAAPTTTTAATTITTGSDDAPEQAPSAPVKVETPTLTGWSGLGRGWPPGVIKRCLRPQDHSAVHVG
ncbi:MAG: hypothetical protein GY939_23750, partial [Actinomycetia bacterium]|nr:hypothetical protein [Actinomycetes bacterium]